LVREWCGDRLKQTYEAAWKEAHSRLYDHLRDTTCEGETPTLAHLAPLYHAIAHGCRAGHRPNRQIEYYSLYRLGAVGSNLAAISCFFDKAYENPVAGLTPSNRSWALGEASFYLRSQGRLQEAIPVMRSSLLIAEVARNWRIAASRARNLCETEMLVGEIAAGSTTSERATDYAQRSRDTYQMLAARVAKAAVVYAASDWQMANDLFVEADQMQQGYQPDFPLLYSSRGYQYCDLLISQGRALEALDRATRTLPAARQDGGLLTIALDTLTLGRAHLLLSLRSVSVGNSVVSDGDEERPLGDSFDEAIEGLRASGLSEYVPRGLLARAAFRRAVGNWDGAARDLDEAQEIAEPGPMRLYRCDIALERARLALAGREPFAPLNGRVEPSPPPPTVPDAGEGLQLLEQARKELDAARNLIAECGYHRRDEELAELDAVVDGRRSFADLPPRV
jgi:tetratricopeptide (TPR) repeat protein